ncbi:MAG TPA: LptA/OstA family protein [Methylomusa anaerophila]|uniref:LPS-assembly protein LptD n=1 Tax=Methylomusa anaerophila TaxID=1930071 RepID=A0A348AMA4_9FIRM|nr:LptA/OstA family protein [Methylomusa anaerophila]BBB92202.1 LPS-assembly protein LptD [Methylomusa anaerophila]HML87784.1 LptA/OstA family protein [Methylomusa anaerophila]
MKRKVFVALVLFLFTFTSIAAVALAKPIIKADTTYYDINTGLYVLKGNVYVEVKDRIITAGVARVSMGSLEVWGSEGITLTQGGISLVADRVHVYGTENRAVIDGNVNFKQTDLTIVADKADFDWRTKLGVFSGNVQITQGNSSWSADSATYNVETNTLL